MKSCGNLSTETIPIRVTEENIDSFSARCHFYIDTDRGGLCDATWSPCIGYGDDKQCERETSEELDKKIAKNEMDNIEWTIRKHQINRQIVEADKVARRNEKF